MWNWWVSQPGVVFYCVHSMINASVAIPQTFAAGHAERDEMRIQKTIGSDGIRADA